MMKKCRINIALITLCLLLISCAGQEETSHDIWPEEKAFAWYEAIGPIKGFNFVPSTAINSTDMWQDITFNIETIDRELSWAKEAGYNSARVFLQYIVWEDNPKGLKERIDQYLEVADNHGISTMFILFDDCRQSGKDPYLGIQDDPVPGVHNGGWTPSPGSQKVTDKSVWPSLENYVKDIVGTYKDDSRVIVWDLYNEPGNAGMGITSLPLVEAAFKWAREAGPSQPLTSGPYGDFTNIFYRNSQMTKHLFDLSDIISFHTYQVPSEVRRVVQIIANNYNRPMLCTEWLLRQTGSDFENILPIFEQFRIGWYHWGLVAGKTQTYMHRRSQPGTPIPEIWQHDVYHSDGRPFDPTGREFDLVRAFDFQYEYP